MAVSPEKHKEVVPLKPITALSKNIGMAIAAVIAVDTQKMFIKMIGLLIALGSFVMFLPALFNGDREQKREIMSPCRHQDGVLWQRDYSHLGGCETPGRKGFSCRTLWTLK